MKNYQSKLYKRKERNITIMNLKNLNDNRHFWKTVKPFLSDKGSHTSKTNLDDEVISDDSTLAETFFKCFEYAEKNLVIYEEINTTRHFESSDSVDVYSALVFWKLVWEYWQWN